MENSLKGLILASGVIITCIIVSLGFFISREAKNAANSGIGKISELTMSQDISKELYDGLRVSGSEVIEVVDKYSQELSEGTVLITVITGKKSAEKKTVQFNSALAVSTTAKDYTSDNYINPNGVFEGEVDTNAKGLVTMTFTQK